jgi:prepilin peptidase CpaA
MTSTIADVVLVAALGCAVYSDLRWRRIANRLTYGTIVAGLLLQSSARGRDGLISALLGLILGGALLLLPCRLGAMGWGDLKLMAAIGALQGPSFVLYTAVYTGLAGGVLALLYLVYARGLPATMSYLVGGWRSPTQRAGTIPYGLAIAAGAIAALVEIRALWP